jgi:hypothetical protein
MRTLLLVALFVSSCNTSTPMTSPLPHIAVTSEGGIAGRGVGGLTIDDPRVAANDTRRTCSGVMTDAERSELASMLSIANSDAPPPGHPDQIRYTLTIGDKTASWYGEEPPAELAKLFKVLWGIRARVLASC